LEGITLRAMSNLERAHRIEIEEEHIAFVEEAAKEFAKWLHRYKELHSRLDYWYNEGQFIPSKMVRLYDAQRFARGVAVRKIVQQQQHLSPRMTSNIITALSTPRADTKNNQADDTTRILPSPIEHQQHVSSARRFLDSSSFKNISNFVNLNESTSSSVKEQHSFVKAAAAAATRRSQIDDDDSKQKQDLLLPLAMRDHVDLSYTYLSLEVMKKYFVALRYSTVVRILDASHCSLGDDTASYLIEVCSGLENLEQLNLSHNPFTNIAATKILAWLESRPTRLKSVDLSHTLVSRPYKKCVEGMLKTKDVNQLDLLRSRVMAITEVFEKD
jgi:hypothetical protein